jgi:hypothetical protein
MSYKIVTSLTKEETGIWTEFVRNHPNGNFFQLPRIVQFYEGLHNIIPFLVAIYENDVPVGFLTGTWHKSGNKLTGFFSSRIVVIGGPLVDINNAHENEITGLILANLSQRFGKKAIYTEFRNLFDTVRYKEIFESHGFKYKEHLNYIVNTRDENEVKAKISKSKLRQINKSLKNNVKIIEAETLDQVNDFYEILKKLYREKVKKPLPGWDFFKKFFEWSQSQSFGKILLVDFNNEIIGGIICPVFGSRAIYELYIAGLDAVSNDVYPSVMATWAPIDYALKNKIDSFDFLGAGSPHSDYGVREFKSKFGGELVNNGRYIKINNRVMYSIGKVGIKLAGRFIN